MRVVIVGDGAVGKTSLLSQLTKENVGHWESEPRYEPTTFNNHVEYWEYEGKEIEVELWDTAGQEVLIAFKHMYIKPNTSCSTKKT